MTGLGFGFSELCMYCSFALAFWYGARLGTRGGQCSFEDTLWALQAIFFGMMMVRFGWFRWCHRPRCSFVSRRCCSCLFVSWT